MAIDGDLVRSELKAMTLRMAGKRLPPERELARMLGVGRPTVRKALAGLEEEGLVVRRQGSGTFAAEAGTGELLSVGLLVDERLRLGDDPFFSRVLESVQRVLQEQSVRCIMHRLAPNGRCVMLEDGVVTVGLAGEKLLENLREEDPPAIGLFLNLPRHKPARFSLLDVDDEESGEQAAKHLLAEGCTKIAFAGLNDLPVSVRRMRGAERAAGGAIAVVRCGMNYKAGLEAAGELAELARDQRLGVVAANDWLAMGLHGGLLGIGRAVRETVRIVGFDGLEVARHSGIRSMVAPLEEIAADALSELRRLAASKTSRGRRIVYPMFLSKGD